jgi:phage gp29-like protein
MKIPFQKNLADFMGRMVSRADIAQRQTEESRFWMLSKELAEHPTRGLTPARLAAIMQEAEQGNLIAQCQLAEDLEEKDAHLFAELQKRKMALQGVDWRIVPPRDASAAEKADAALIEQIITDMLNMDDIITDMSDAILKGYSNQELEWEFVDGLHIPRSVEYRPGSWFQLNPDNLNQLRLRDGSHHGAELQPFGWISHAHKAKSGYLGRMALARVVAWPFLFKNLSLRDLAEFLEIYGLPVKLGRYPSGANDKEKSTLMRALASIGHNAVGIIPKGMDVEFKEAAKGAEGPFKSMIDWAERSMSKAILGGTLTSGTGEGTNTNALGNVHNEVRKELRQSDLKQIAATLTRDLVFPLYALNGKSFNGNRRLPLFEFDIDEYEELSTAIYPLMRMVEMGVDDIPVSWLHEKYGIPTAATGDKVLKPSLDLPAGSEPAQLRANWQRPGFAVLKSLPPMDDQQALDDALNALTEGQLNDQVLQLLTPVFALAEKGPEELQAGLAELWPDMADTQLEETLTRILFVSELWGELSGGVNG